MLRKKTIEEEKKHKIVKGIKFVGNEINYYQLVFFIVSFICWITIMYLCENKIILALSTLELLSALWFYAFQNKT